MDLGSFLAGVIAGILGGGAVLVGTLILCVRGVPGLFGDEPGDRL